MPNIDDAQLRAWQDDHSWEPDNPRTLTLLNEDARELQANGRRLLATIGSREPKASEKREADKLLARADLITELLGRRGNRQRADDALNALIYPSGSPTPEASAFGQQFRNAIDEVLEGRSASYVDIPRASLYESGSPGDGVPEQLKSPVSTLTASSVVMSLPGIRTESMTSDRARYPRVGAVTADGTAEGATLTDADTQTDSITVVAQKFSTYEELSTELVEDYSADALAAFGNNMVKHLGLRVDLGLLQGDGANDVVGIRTTPGINTTSVAGVPSNFASFRAVELELRTANGDPRVWLMAPRTWSTLAGIKTGISSDETTLLEPDPQRGPRTLLGFPVAFSTQITLTEGATSAGSWAALLDTSQLVILERRPARLEVSRDFKFDEDKLAVRATWRGGLAVLNPEAISIATDVRAS